MSKVQTTRLGLTLESANPTEYPIGYSDNIWALVTADSVLSEIAGEAGNYTEQELLSKIAARILELSSDGAIGTSNLANGSVILDKLSEDVKNVINNAGKADNQSIVKNEDATLSVKEGGIVPSMLSADVTAILDAKVASANDAMVDAQSAKTDAEAAKEAAISAMETTEGKIAEAEQRVNESAQTIVDNAKQDINTSVAEKVQDVTNQATLATNALNNLVTALEDAAAQGSDVALAAEVASRKLADEEQGEKLAQLGLKTDDIIEEINNQHPRTNEAGFHVIDSQGNIGMQYTDEGLDFSKLTQHAIEVLKGHDLGGTANVVQTQENGFFVVDGALNVGMKVDSDGVHAKNILDFEIV